MFRRTQSDEVVDSCKYAAGSCVWRTQSDEVIDGCKGIGRGFRICHARLRVQLHVVAASR